MEDSLNPGTNVCCVCYSIEVVDGEEQNDSYWTCTTCRKRCHMHCIRTWATSNHNRTLATFSCPHCRQSFNLSSLPGLHLDDTHTSPLESLRPGLSSFIATVLRSTSQWQPTGERPPAPFESTFEPVSDTTASTTNQSVRNHFSVSGTGPIHVENLTIINHF